MLDNFKELRIVKERKTKAVADIVPMAIVSENERPSYSRFEAWVEGKGQECPAPVLQVIGKHRDIFMDTLPPGLPPERVPNYTITPLPGNLPSKRAIYGWAPIVTGQLLPDAGVVTHGRRPQ